MPAKCRAGDAGAKSAVIRDGHAGMASGVHGAANHRHCPAELTGERSAQGGGQAVGAPEGAGPFAGGGEGGGHGLELRPDLPHRLAVRQSQPLAADTRSEAEKFLGDPPAARSALAQNNVAKPRNLCRK